MSESGISPGYSGCKAIEINKIFYHSLIVLHPESFELILRISFGIVWSEVAFELGGELGIIGDQLEIQSRGSSLMSPGSNQSNVVPLR